MDRCTWETRQLLERILSGWHELAPVLPDLEQHLAETVRYPVQVQHHELAVSAARIARFLAEEHGQPAAAIGHLHDWLVSVTGAQLRNDWVAFLVRVQGAPGLTVRERADLVAIAGVLCFPPVAPVRADGRRLVELATHALVIGSPALLLEDLAAQQEQELAQHARAAVEKSRNGPPRGTFQLPHVITGQGSGAAPRWPLLAGAAVAVLAAAGIGTVLLLHHGPTVLQEQSVTWTGSVVEPDGKVSTSVDIPPGATRMDARLLLADPAPGTGSCHDLTARLTTDQDGESDWQAPGQRVSVPVPAGRTTMTVNLWLHGPAGCGRQVQIETVRFTR